MAIASLASIESLCRRIARRLSVAVTLVLVAMLLAALGLPVSAAAVVHPATVLDGPSNEILEVDGAAMARDGTGGVLYRKEVNGVAHVFVVPFDNDGWGRPLEVDGEDAYGASQPAIAAGQGGRLLVLWVQPRAINAHGVKLYELMSSSLQPGASGFGAAIVVDQRVSEPITGEVSGVDPTLAMAPSGRAYVVYRVITDSCSGEDPANGACTAGDKLVEVRVARFNFLSWSSLGAINRAPQIAMRAPTAANAPSIGIDLSGNAVVAWQEPDSGGVARIWVRRLFGLVQGNVLQASPETIGGRAVTSDAEAPAVAVGPYGETRIAYRIQGAPGSAATTTQLYLNSLLSEVDPHGSQLQGATPVPGAAQAGLGVPSDVIDETEGFRLAWSQGGVVQELAGGDDTVGSPVAIGMTGGQALTTINPAGGGTTAWTSPLGAPPTVQVREDYAQGAYQQAQLAGAVAGPITGLALGGDGQGDALLAFSQGQPGQAEVVGDLVQAPPEPFSVNTPVGWVRGRAAQITWEAAPDPLVPLTYTVYIDGKPRIGGLTGLSASLSPVALGDGIHHIQILATDPSGQQTMSSASVLKVDANPPIVRAKLVDRGDGVRISVTDDASGVDNKATVISFGDGSHSRRHAHVIHLYRHAGRYLITARVRDKVGNSATVHLRVTVR